MKRLLLATTLLAALGSSHANAGNVVVTGYSTPDNDAFNVATTTAAGASDTPYSYYTGPVVFSVQGGPDITVYCVDLNHYLSSGVYKTGILDHNGEGQTISEFDSNRIGWIATIGAAALWINDTSHQLIAAAAQAAIWDIAYDADSPTSVSSDALFNTVLTAFLGDVFADKGYATALIPVDPLNNQEMVMGFAASTPEASTWAMGLIGFGLVALMGAAKGRRAFA